jgi:hypothetical protein
MISRTSSPNFFHVQLRSHSLFCSAVAILIAITPFAAGQTTLQTPLPAAAGKLIASNLSANLSVNLPDSPGFMASSSTDAAADSSADPDESQENPQSAAGAKPQPPNARTKHSPHLEMTIAPNEIAEPMPVHDKITGGLKDSVSLFSAAGWFASAGWEQLTNGSPNYGTDKGAFGQRLGAAAVRDISEDIFSSCLFAPVFHEDPRYYIMGRGNNFFKRVTYAATRAIITRTDSGHTTPNFSLLAGNAAGAALTVTYYPSLNTSFTEVAKTFGGSVGGNAIGYVVTEFIADALEFSHLKKRD